MCVVLANSAHNSLESRVAIEEGLVAIEQMIDVDAVLIAKILLRDDVPDAKEG